MNRKQRCERIESLGLIPVVRAPSAEGALALSRALFKGGIRCFEITLTVPNGVEVLRTLRAEWGSGAFVGAGTVTDEVQAQNCLDAGAEFLVSPALLPGLVPVGHAAEVPVMLGALTPTEILQAWRAGADYVKVFPCSALGGAEYLKALQGPLPDIRIMPTGGVHLETLLSYKRAGAAVLGVGTALADHSLLVSQGEAALVELTKKYVERFARAV